MSAENSVDRISLLPDGLLHHILSCLDTKQVVRTCVLSKRWNAVWTCIPTLNFDFCLFEPYEEPGYVETTDDLVMKVRSFHHSVLRVLSKHCGSIIQKLRYYSWIVEHDDGKYLVEFLICYATCHMVKELDINIYSDDDIYFDWIRWLSICQSLNVLRIRSFSPDNEWGVLMLPSLRILVIEGSSFWLDIKYKENMFSGCPNLESLVLANFGWEGCATIFVPKLENFEYGSTIGDWDLNFQEIELCTPNLRRVKFDYVIPIVKSVLGFPCLDKVNIKGDFCFNKEMKGDNDSDFFYRIWSRGRTIA